MQESALPSFRTSEARSRRPRCLEEDTPVSSFVFNDTTEGPRAPAVKPRACHSSLTRVRAAPLSPGVGQSDFARLRRLTTLLLTQGGVLFSLVPLVWEFSVDTALLEIEAEPRSPAEFAVVAETVDCRVV
jgi:hypothetical protein